MVPKLTIAIVASFLVSVAACTHTLGVGPDSPARLVERFIGGFNHLDTNEMKELFAEDATAFLPSPDHPTRVEGRDAIIAIFEPMFAAERKRHSGPDYLHLQAKGLAIQLSGGSAVATFDIGTSEVYSRRTLVIERRSGCWRIIHLHASNLRMSPSGG